MTESDKSKKTFGIDFLDETKDSPVYFGDLKTKSTSPITDTTVKNDDAFDLMRPITYAGRMGALLSKGRLISYSSEVGEAIRPIAPKWMVKTLWGVSFGYVGVDLWHHWYTRKDMEREKLMLNVGDRALWHASASLAVPALTIHSVVKASKKIFNATRYSKHAGVCSTLIGLGIIPFIVHPIDHGTHCVMNGTVRKFGNYYDDHTHHDD